MLHQNDFVSRGNPSFLTTSPTATSVIGRALYRCTGRTLDRAFYAGIRVRSQGGSGPAFQSPSLSVTVFSPPCQRFSNAKGSEPRDRRGSQRELSGGASRVSG